MKNTINNTLKIISLISLMIVFCDSNMLAQSRWVDWGNDNSISLEIYKPFVPKDSSIVVPGGITPGLTAPSGAVFLTGRYNIYKQLTLIGEIPFAGGDIDDSTVITPGYVTKIGNPYLGVEYRVPQSPLMFELGLRLPLTPDSGVALATVAGTRTDVDRTDAFIRKIVPVYFAVNYKTVSESNILFNAKVGANVWFNTKSIGFYNQPYLSIPYALQVGYLDKYVHILTGLSGVYAMDTSPQYPKKDNFIQYGLLITVPYKNIRPGLSIKVPGADAGKIFNYVLGLNFTYGFK